MKHQLPAGLYKSIFDNANDGILLASLETKNFYIANKAICKMLGYSKKELEKLGVADIHPKKDTPYVVDQFERQAKGELILSKDLPVKRKDGSVFYADVNGTPIKIAGKTYLIGVFRDNTKRKNMEQKLDKYAKVIEKKAYDRTCDLENARIAAQNVLEDLSDEKSKVEMAKAKEEAILMSIGDGLLATDEKGNIIRMNRAAEETLGFKSKEVTGKAVSDLIPMKNEEDEPIPSDKRPINMALVTGTTTTTTTTDSIYYYVRKDKTKFPVAITVTPVIFGGKMIGSIEVFRNITQEKEIDRAKSEFISLASHQLKTPPTAIKLLTERLLGGKIGTPTKKQKEYLGDIYSSNQRMIDLINTLLHVSRIELGAFAIQINKKDPCAIIQSLLIELKPIIDKKQLRLKTTMPRKKMTLMLDESLFRMVINNLITNAIHYTAEGGKLWIECETASKGENLGKKLLDKNYFVVTVSDTGYGIPQNQQSKMFTKFFRAGNAREKYADGTGLGLYIVKSILDHSGGLIWFTSRENVGSLFYVAIPLTGMRERTGEKNLIGS